MTAATITPVASLAPAWPRRVWNVVKLHTANPWATIYLPGLITLGVLALHFVIWQTIATAAGGFDKLEDGALQITGGMSWIAFYLMIAAIQAMNLTFRFAMSLSVTRRDYFSGTALYFVMLSIGFAIAITLGAAAERATDGWGIDAGFFAPGLFNGHSLWVVGFCWAMYLMVMFGIGIASAAVFVRWKANGMVVMFMAITLLLATAIWFVTWSGSWAAVGRFFTDRSLVEIAAWTLVLTVPANVVGYLLLRRSAPRQ